VLFLQPIYRESAEPIILRQLVVSRTETLDGDGRCGMLMRASGNAGRRATPRGTRTRRRHTRGADGARSTGSNPLVTHYVAVIDRPHCHVLVCNTCGVIAAMTGAREHIDPPDFAVIAPAQRYGRAAFRCAVIVAIRQVPICLSWPPYQ
jgi:hypothetical protein